MYHWLDEPRFAHEGVMVRTLWVTIILSALVHLAALLLWIPHTRLFSPGEETLEPDRLEVRLAASPPPAPPTPPPSRETPPSAPARPLKTSPRAPVMTVPKVAVPSAPLPRIQAPTIPVPPPTPAPEVAASRPTPPPTEPDLSAYIQARRHERGLPDSASSSEARPHIDSAIAANLPAPAHGVAAQDPKRGGGLFEIKRMDFDDAAFEFFGWNADMQRRTPQLIEVRKGDNSDMRIAVVRRMIAVIREYSKDDFVWRSVRHNKDYVLSARLSDNAALEDFLMHEFFDDPAMIPN
jgi:hypothetical protein